MAPTTFFVPLQVPSCQPVLVGGLVLADDHLHLYQGGRVSLGPPVGACIIRRWNRGHEPAFSKQRECIVGDTLVIHTNYDKLTSKKIYIRTTYDTYSKMLYTFNIILRRVPSSRPRHRDRTRELSDPSRPSDERLSKGSRRSEARGSASSARDSTGR